MSFHYKFVIAEGRLIIYFNRRRASTGIACVTFVASVAFITFIACTILTFASGSNWGATLAVAAIVIPLCAALQGNMILVLAAIVSGAAFGAHVCFYCDVTVFTSGMTKIDNIEHAVTQLPYGLLGMAVSCVGYLLAGFLLH